MSEKTVQIDGIDVDVDKANKILKKVLITEKTNLSTKKLTSQELIKDIKKKIAEEVKCF
ncbi:hypothetical protein SAMN04487775_10753 [Treponema bryantii]|uniref:Uncharacterized protein n=1 Tax=Treponema bryantii TaxID=163 RepID=A0A1I3LL07_9SPIR|nr:hypothetical protein [Treponema bryantii]SFI85438.1 hypothetical protein SAMN04487775_10753 [Treponema bryantii]